MKQNLQTSFNVIKSVKTVAEKLENSKLDSSGLMAIESDCNDLSAYLGVEQNQVMIFCVAFILDFLGNEVRLIDIAEHIDLNTGQTESVQNDLNILVERKLIDLKPVSRQTGDKEQSNLVFVINPKIAVAILSNSIILSNNLDNPMNIFQFTETIRELVDFTSMELINTTQLLNAIERLEQVNENLNAIRELKEYDLRLIDRIVLYYMFAILICWNTGCSLNMTINAIFCALGRDYKENLAIIEGNSDLINNGFISTRKSQMFEDYYIELKADVLVLFLVEKSNTYPTNNLLFTDSIIHHNESYFNNN
jgi:hypothetical protein